MKIERHVPMPAPKPLQPKRDRIPIENMEVGDSLFFSGRTRVSAVGQCKATAMKAGLCMNFRSAAEGDGVRVWRTA